MCVFFLSSSNTLFDLVSLGTLIKAAPVPSLPWRRALPGPCSGTFQHCGCCFSFHTSYFDLRDLAVWKDTQKALDTVNPSCAANKDKTLTFLLLMRLERVNNHVFLPRNKKLLCLDGISPNNWWGDLFEMAINWWMQTFFSLWNFLDLRNKSFKWSFWPNFQKPSIPFQEHKLIFSRVSLGQWATTLSAIRQMRDEPIFSFFCVFFVVCRWLASERDKARRGSSSGNAQMGVRFAVWEISQTLRQIRSLGPSPLSYVMHCMTDFAHTRSARVETKA